MKKGISALVILISLFLMSCTPQYRSAYSPYGASPGNYGSYNQSYYGNSSPPYHVPDFVVGH